MGELRDDDKELIAAATKWTRRHTRDVQKGIMVLTQMTHKRAVIGRLREEGWLPIQSDNPRSPVNADTLFVRTSGDMMSGVRVDKLFIHPDCPERVWDALRPCAV